MVPAAPLTTVNPPLPMVPLPSMVLFVLVRIRPPVFCWIQAQPPLELFWDRVTVPPPVRVVLVRRLIYPLAPPPPFS